MAITTTEWSRKVEISYLLTNTSVSGFPALITDINLPSEIWAIANDGGGDLRVCLNEDGTNQLPIEVSEFNTTTEKAAIHVRFPTFTNGSELWLFYGKIGETQPVASDSFGRNAVWAGFVGVYHLYGPNGLVDSSGNSPDLTITGGASPTAISKLGIGAYDFTRASGQYLQANVSPTFASHSIMAWVRNETLTVNNAVYSLTSVGDNDDYNTLLYRDSPDFDLTSITQATAGELDLVTDSEVTPLNTWVHSVGTFNNSAISLYKDGALGVSATPAIIKSTDAPYTLTIGGRLNEGTVSLFMDGQIESVKVYDGTISADHIALEESNQSDLSAFWATGSPADTGSGNTPPVATDPNDISVGFGQPFSFEITLSDLEDDAVTYTIQDVNGHGYTISDSRVGDVVTLSGPGISETTETIVEIGLTPNDGTVNGDQVVFRATIAAMPITSTATFNISGVPLTSYQVDFRNPSTEVLLERQTLTPNGSNFTATLSQESSTPFRAVVFTSTHVFGNDGVTT